MNIVIENLDKISETEREAFKRFLEDMIAGDDEKLKEYIVSYLSDTLENGARILNADQLWESAVIQQRFVDYEWVPSVTDELTNLLSDFDDQSDIPDLNLDSTVTSEFEESALPVIEDNLIETFGGDEPRFEDEMAVPPFTESEEIQSLGLTNTEWEIPEPKLGIPKDNNKSTTPRGVRSDLIPFATDLGGLETYGPQDQAPGPDEPPELKDERIQSLEEQLHHLKSSTGTVAQPSIIADGPAGVGRAALLEGGKTLLTGAGELVGGSMKLAGRFLSGSGKLAGHVVSDERINRAVKASMDALGKKTSGLFKFGGNFRKAFSGEAGDSSVVDIKNHINMRIAGENTLKIERELELLNDASFRNHYTVVSDIVKGLNDSRYSDIELTKDVTAGAAMAAVLHGSENEAAMGRALLMQGSDLPNPVTEMNIVASEYLALTDHLKTLREHCDRKGWSLEEIAQNFGDSLDEWLASRSEEDDWLRHFCDLKPVGPEGSMEEKEAAKKSLESAIKAVKEAIASLIGKDRLQEQALSNMLTITR